MPNSNTLALTLSVYYKGRLYSHQLRDSGRFVAETEAQGLLCSLTQTTGDIKLEYLNAVL